MATTYFDGYEYNDDRMFVFYLGKCTVETIEDGVLETTVYFDDPPPLFKWCLVTYRNTPQYPPFRTDRFDSLDEAKAYLREAEPTVPLISLNGNSPRDPLPYDEFVRWKLANRLREFDADLVYTSGGNNRQERHYSRNG